MVTKNENVGQSSPKNKRVSFKESSEILELEGLGNSKEWVSEASRIKDNNEAFLIGIAKESLKDEKILNILNQIDNPKKKIQKLGNLTLKKVIHDEIKAAEQDDGTWVNSLLSEDFGDVIKLDLGNRR